MIIGITFGIALLLCWLLIPLVRMYSFRFGKVSMPRVDRWHQKPTPSMGGIAIFTAFCLSLMPAVFMVIFPLNRFYEIQPGTWQTWFNHIRPWGFLVGSIFIFGFGLYDDLRHLSPPTKLIGQIIAATIVILSGYVSNFFTPRLTNILIAQFLNILLTFIWLVGITNAINLLDNMDGLAGGISLIATLLLGYLFWQAGNLTLVYIAAALAGSLIGFLYYNFPPAKIFMGDSGSMFLGFTLASLAIARQPQASNVFAVLGVPTLLFLLPIMDTILVTFTRIMRGESPAKGGRDHTSHRLVAFGLNERQALLILYSVALLSGILAIAVESIGYRLSLILVPILVLGLALALAYLGGMKVSTPDVSSNKVQELDGTNGSNDISGKTNPIVRVMLNLTYKRRILEVILDFVIIILAFYLAFVTRYGLFLNQKRLLLFTQALPIALAVTYLCFFTSGVYRAVWRYIGLHDLIRYVKAALLSGAFSALIIYLVYYYRVDSVIIQPVEAYNPILFILLGLYLFMGLAASRSSFKLLDQLILRQTRITDERVIIYGAGDTGEMALRWIFMNPDLKIRPVGFIDDDPLKSGRYIHGVRVIGSSLELDNLLDSQQIQGVIIAQATPDADRVNAAISMAKRHGCWARNFNLEFTLLEK